MGASTFTIGYLVGSLASDSLNRRLAGALVRLAPPTLHLEEIPLAGLPLFSRDLEADLPVPVRELKRRIEGSDGILVVTPEYNRDIPGALKNAIDWASRPKGSNSFDRKPTAVIGASPGRLGTVVAQQNLRAVLSFLNAPQMNAPEAYVQYTEGLVDEDGRVTDPGTEELLRRFMAEFADFVERVLTVLPRRL